MSRQRIALIVPGEPEQPTGGYRYDARIASELRLLGIEVDVIGLPGHFPDADSKARTALDAALQGLADGSIAVIDGLALGGLPDVVGRHGRHHDNRLMLVGLVHHPLADETGLAPALRARFLQSEREALDACHRVVTTSAFIARRLDDLGVARGRIRVVPPGVDPAPKRRPHASTEHRLLCVGSLSPRKGQDLLVEALAGLTGFAWRLKMVGDAGRDPEFAAGLRAAIAAHGLEARAVLAGVQDTAALGATYRGADVLVVPSHYEGYGMVVTEALACALPVIATDGGALADTVPQQAGLQVPAGDPQALAGALRRWFAEPRLRAAKTAGALAVRPTLDDWSSAGRRFAAALEMTEAAPAP